MDVVEFNPLRDRDFQTANLAVGLVLSALGKSIALTIAIAAPVSALLLSLARKPYCRALSAIAF
jgi:hypothetical protein